MKRISENEGFQYRATFREDGVEVTPTTVHWRVTKSDTGEVVQDWTSVTPSSSVTITVRGWLNTLASQYVKSERRLLTIVWDKGLDLEKSVDVPYLIAQTGR